MTKKTAEEQTQITITNAKTNKGSQRILVHALVDKDSYVSFYVPEWLVALNPTDFENVKSIPEGAKPWVAKKSTKKPTTEDENLPTTGGTGTGTTTGNRRARKQAPGAIASEDTGTKFVGKPVKVYLSAEVKQQKGEKKYKHRTFRVHQAMTSMSVMYFLQQTVKAQVTSFQFGKSRYAIDAVTIEPDNLGSLRDEAGATTTPGTAPTKTP